MTPSEADQRIVLSRQTLYRYRAMIDGGLKPEADQHIMEQEIALLVDLVQVFPEKADKIAALAGQWRELMGKIRTVH